MAEPDNAAVVRDAFEAFKRGDVAALFAAFDPSIKVEFYGPASLPFAGRFVGLAGIQEYLGRIAAALEFLDFEPREFLCDGAQVVVLGSSRVRARSTQVEARYEWATVSTVINGRITRYRVYDDTAALRDALTSQTT